MTVKQIVYLALSLLGLVSTWVFNLQFMGEDHPRGALDFIEASFANAASSSLAVDIGVVFFAFCVWVVAESRRLGMRYSWVWPPLALFVALAFAMPLFLFLRERHLETQEGMPVVS